MCNIFKSPCGMKTSKNYFLFFSLGEKKIKQTNNSNQILNVEISGKGNRNQEYKKIKIKKTKQENYLIFFSKF